MKSVPSSVAGPTRATLPSTTSTSRAQLSGQSRTQVVTRVSELDIAEVYNRLEWAQGSEGWRQLE